MEERQLKSMSDVSERTVLIGARNKTLSRSSRDLSSSNAISMMSLSERFAREDSGDSEGEALATIPFNWESRPGTPKVRPYCDTPASLTPPPSYYPDPANSTTTRMRPRKIKTGFLRTIFPGLPSKNKKSRSPQSSASTSWWSSSSSSWSLSSCSIGSDAGQGRTSTSTRLSFNSREKESDMEEEYGSPANPRTTLCFGMGRRTIAAPRGSWSAPAISRLLRGEHIA